MNTRNATIAKIICAAAVALLLLQPTAPATAATAAVPAAQAGGTPLQALLGELGKDVQIRFA